ncbi:MAG: glycosyltransferase [Acidobacteriales bacterium]|nr:glycosyltransferase [Terriglobales bacterium]
MGVVLVFCFLLAALAAGTFAVNLRIFQKIRREPVVSNRPLSVLMPVRNEEGNLAAALDAILANGNVPLEVIVGDDNSSDGTRELALSYAQRDARVRYLAISPLPRDWNGKQHACHELARAASHETLCFVDADVRLAPDALERSITFLDRSGAMLVSGFPRQQLETWLEQLFLPLIHFILLAYLPIGAMRRTTKPSYAAGCGQLFLINRHAYRACGGHAAIRNSLHDGIALPRTFRAAGFKTDLFDASDLASCRMYKGAGQVWDGLVKNAVEGMAAPSRILIFTVLLMCGQVLPILFLANAFHHGKGLLLALAAFGTVFSFLPRLIAARRFHQPLWSALAHPVGVLLLLAIQWYALARHLAGMPSVWRGREYSTGT